MSKGLDISLIDTDGISLCKSSGEPFSNQEREILLKELNEISPDFMVWEEDGMCPVFLVLRAKNYVMLDEKGSIKYKGSSIKSATLEPALKEFIHEIISALLTDKTNYEEIYLKYVKEILDIKDIKRWASKKALSETTINSTRTNETKIMDAIKDAEYVAGDRVYLYFKSDDTLGLVENFNNDYSKDRLLKKLHNATERFSDVLNIKELFLNYSLKRNKQKLLELSSNKSEALSL